MAGDGQPADFNPLSPHGERRDLYASGGYWDSNFNPLSPHGERLCGLVCYITTLIFQSTLPTRGETRGAAFRTYTAKFQSTLPTRGETHGVGTETFCGGISIHSPHTGRDMAEQLTAAFLIRFQSTLPTRGETGLEDACRPCRQFQSTLPTRGETGLRPPTCADLDISIHSPHTGRDNLGCKQCGHRRNFNPLSPHGERQYCSKLDLPPTKISIHSPHTGRDVVVIRIPQKDYISIHSPHTGRDWCGNKQCKLCSNFNPLSPHGERRIW